MAAPVLASDSSVVTYHPRGGVRTLFECRDKEALVEGSAGTGKSFGCLWKLHACALKYPGMRALMVRKTAVSLTASALVTFQERVLGAGAFGVRFFGGSKAKPASFLYPNGSVIVVGGLDNPTKIMSAEYDLAYANEATELTENDWETVTARLRYGVMPYQQLLADCNPDAPSHWLNQRCEKGVTTRIRTQHEDNPTLFDHVTGQWTARGAAYIETLDRLTGVRKQRLRYGLWVAAEGQIYDTWRSEVHIVRREDVEKRLIGAWYIGTADWGWTNAGVAQIWAVDRDGRLYLVAEHYHTRQPFEGWWVPRFVQLDAQYEVERWVCDPSEPQNIDRLRTAGLNAGPAVTDLLPGIGTVQDRLVFAGDGLPRLFVLEDALIQRDEHLAEDKLPWSTAQEVPEYVWAKNVGGVSLKDKPVDAHNHGLDAARYACAELDLKGRSRPLDAGVLAHFAGLPG